jgi:hypothetical protein
VSETLTTTLDLGELVAAIDREWDAACEHNRNPLVCETCRTYDNVLDTIDALVDNRAARTATGRIMTDGYFAELVDEAEQGYVPDGRGGLRVPDVDEVERTCNVEHPQARGWHCDVRGPHDTHSATLHGVARYRWTS